MDEDIINDFKEETNELLEKLNDVVEELEETEESFPKDLLENFSQQIARIMGAASTMAMMDEQNMALPAIT